MRSHSARLTHLERAQRHHSAQDEPVEVFANTQAATAAFCAKYGRKPTLADLHELVAMTWGTICDTEHA